MANNLSTKFTTNKFSLGIFQYSFREELLCRKNIIDFVIYSEDDVVANYPIPNITLFQSN